MIRLLGLPLCRHDPDLWFPNDRSPVQTRKQIEVVTAICGGCAVKEACYAGAVQRGETSGIWGGVNFFVSRPKRRRNAA